MLEILGSSREPHICFYWELAARTGTSRPPPIYALANVSTLVHQLCEKRLVPRIANAA